MEPQNTIQDEAVRQEAEMMLEMDEEELHQMLGMRLQAINRNVNLSMQPTIEAQAAPMEAMALPSWANAAVDSMIEAALRQLRNVACSEKEEFRDLRNQLGGALGLSGGALVLSFAAFLTGTLGVAAALAPVIAAILIQRLGVPTVRAGYDAICAELAKELSE